MGSTAEETLQPIASPAQLCLPLRLLTQLLARRIVSLASALGVAGIALGSAAPTHASVPPDTLYGAGLLSATNRFQVVTIDPIDGITPLSGEAGYFQDLAFDSSGRLFATAGCYDLPNDFPSCEFFPSSMLVGNREGCFRPSADPRFPHGAAWNRAALRDQ